MQIFINEQHQYHTVFLRLKIFFSLCFFGKNYVAEQNLLISKMKRIFIYDEPFSESLMQSMFYGNYDGKKFIF